MNGIGFRTQLGGYNKDDVNKYIKETDEKHAENIAKAAEELNSANEKLAEVEKTLTESSEALDCLKAEKEKNDSAVIELKKRAHEAEETLGQRNDELKKLGDELNNEINKAKELEVRLKEYESEVIAHKNAEKASSVKIEELVSALEKKNAEIARLSDENKNYASALSQKQNESEFLGDINDKNSRAYKLAMYDKISSELGDLMINANRNADAVLSQAKENAEKMLAQAEDECAKKRKECELLNERTRSETEQEAAYIRKRLSDNAKTLLSEVSASLHGNIENCVREITSCITDMQYELNSLVQKIDSRNGELNDRIEYYQGVVSDGIEEKLTKMDEKYGIVPVYSDGGGK